MFGRVRVGVPGGNRGLSAVWWAQVVEAWSLPLVYEKLALFFILRTGSTNFPRDFDAGDGLHNSHDVPSLSEHTHILPSCGSLGHLLGQEHSVLSNKKLYLLNRAVTAVLGSYQKPNRAVNRPSANGAGRNVGVLHGLVEAPLYQVNNLTSGAWCVLGKRIAGLKRPTRHEDNFFVYPYICSIYETTSTNTAALLLCTAVCQGFLLPLPA